MHTMREALQNNCHKHHYAEQRLPGTLLFERKIAFSGLQPRKPFLAFQKGDTFHRMGRGGGGGGGGSKFGTHW